jgi:hypothetical protein
LCAVVTDAAAATTAIVAAHLSVAVGHARPAHASVAGLVVGARTTDSTAAIGATRLAVTVGDARPTQALANQPRADVTGVLTAVIGLEAVAVAEAPARRLSTAVASAAGRARALPRRAASLTVIADATGATAPVGSAARIIADRLAGRALPSGRAELALGAGPADVRAAIGAAGLAVTARLAEPAADLAWEAQDRSAALADVLAAVRIIKAARVTEALAWRP